MRKPDEMHFCEDPLSQLAEPKRSNSGTHLEQIPRLANDIEQELPPRNFRLASTSNDDLERFIKVIQEFDDAGQDGDVVLCRRVREDRSGRRRSSIGFVLEDRVEEDLECVGKVDEVLVVRGEENGFFPLVLGEVEAEDVVDEEMRLPRAGSELAK